MLRVLNLFCILALVLFAGLRFEYIAAGLAQESAHDLFYSGLAHHKDGDIDNAIIDYTMAIQIDPQDRYAFYNRGLAYQTRGDLDNAISDYTMAIQIDPYDSSAYLNRGIAYQSRGDLEMAMSDYTAALAINPYHEKVHANRGITRHETGDVLGAIADLEQAVRLNPNLEYAVSALAAARETLAAQALRTDQEPSLDAGTKRVALVVGNGQYKASGDILHNAEDDARDIANALRLRGYDLYGGGPQLNLTLEQFDTVIEGFKNASIGADDAVVWYAGHGQQFAEEGGVTSNWLIPVDAEVKSVNDLRRRTIKLSNLFDTVEPANKLRLVIIDACRNSSFKTETTRGSTRGFGRVERPGLILVFSTKPGTTADDGKKEDRNSPFATAFLESLKSYNDQYVTQFLGGVAGKTSQLTNQTQRPEVISDIQTADHLAL